ncbi:MAG: class I SAM-dependent methyltransferase, partial [Nanoarchaeota archaeon]
MYDQEVIWDILADSWHNFRNKPDPISIYFRNKYAKIPGKIIDLGCGNCRNLILFKGYECYGVDFSSNMLEKAKIISKKFNLKIKLKKSNLVSLDFKNNFFDYALMIASLHHIKTNELRFTALKELYRVLKKDGIALITVWNKWQLRFLFSRKNSHVKWHKKDKIYYRYYYLFNYFELKRLIKRAGFKI